jgi:hypothetical protein
MGFYTWGFSRDRIGMLIGTFFVSWIIGSVFYVSFSKSSFVILVHLIFSGLYGDDLWTY